MNKKRYIAGIRRFSGRGRELDEIEQCHTYFREHASEHYFMRLEKTYDDAISDNLPDRAEQVRRCLALTAPKEDIDLARQQIEEKKKSQEFREMIMR